MPQNVLLEVLAERIYLGMDSTAGTFACVLCHYPKLSMSVRAISCVVAPYSDENILMRNLTTIITSACGLQQLEITASTPMQACELLSAVQSGTVLVRLEIQPYVYGPRMLGRHDFERPPPPDKSVDVVPQLRRFTSLRSLVWRMEYAKFSESLVASHDALQSITELSIGCACNSLFRWLAGCRYEYHSLVLHRKMLSSRNKAFKICGPFLCTPQSAATALIDARVMKWMASTPSSMSMLRR